MPGTESKTAVVTKQDSQEDLDKKIEAAQKYKKKASEWLHSKVVFLLVPLFIALIYWLMYKTKMPSKKVLEKRAAEKAASNSSTKKLNNKLGKDKVIFKGDNLTQQIESFMTVTDDEVDEYIEEFKKYENGKKAETKKDFYRKLVDDLLYKYLKSDKPSKYAIEKVVELIMEYCTPKGVGISQLKLPYIFIDQRIPLLERFALFIVDSGLLNKIEGLQLFCEVLGEKISPAKLGSFLGEIKKLNDWGEDKDTYKEVHYASESKSDGTKIKELIETITRACQRQSGSGKKAPPVGQSPTNTATLN